MKNALIIILGLLFALPASAQPREPSKEDRQRAKKLFAQGTELHKSGDYRAAAKKYQAAFDLVPRPLFLFNVAQVYRLNGDREQAINYYEQYLEMDADGRGSATARKFLGELKAQMAKDKRDEERKKPKKDEDDEPDVEDTATTRADIDDDDSDAEITSSGGGSTGKIMVWSGLGVAVVGAVGIAVGVKFGLDSKSISDELSNNRDPWTAELLAKQDEGKRKERNSLIFTSVEPA